LPPITSPTGIFLAPTEEIYLFLKKHLHFEDSSAKIYPLFCFRRCPDMAKCDICGKSMVFGIKVSHSHRRSNRVWKPNIKRVKAVVDGSPKRIYACTRCLRSGKVTRAL
jgi:large subunit ribosomal protein L28